ncbi:hypothetical protein E6O75_ATG11188 [Venturia nashicola]|uniref:Uncharacterized protein n=1 Tax=Venturia nashicola TaxID=86259 RepID=A0A4Z1PKK2_9PEZI|nr:hypothetical protein E6O75_ATG11188 [Venturia nashicola]
MGFRLHKAHSHRPRPRTALAPPSPSHRPRTALAPPSHRTQPPPVTCSLRWSYVPVPVHCSIDAHHALSTSSRPHRHPHHFLYHDSQHLGCVMGSAAPDDVQAETSPSAILLHFAHFAHFSSILGLRCELDFSLDPEFQTIQTPKLFLRRCQPDRLLPDKHHNPSRASLGELTPGPTIQGSFPIPSGF